MDNPALVPVIDDAPNTVSQPLICETVTAADVVSRQSLLGLNAANFFLAEITGVVMPFLGAYLKMRHWSETAIGLAISIAGLGVFLMQTPAGIIVDKMRRRRTLLASSSILLGVCYGLLPLVPTHTSWIDPLLFIAGMGQAFFLPLL